MTELCLCSYLEFVIWKICRQFLSVKRAAQNEQTHEDQKKSEDSAAGKNNLPIWNLLVTLQHCFDYGLCTQSIGQQYCFLSPVSPLEELVLLYKFQLQKVAHTRICSKPILRLCSQQEFWSCKTAGLELKNSMDFSSCCHANKAVQ